MNKKLMKKSIGELNLGKYYNDFIRDDDSYKYQVVLYLYKVMCDGEEVIYIGNKQRPKKESEDYTDLKYNMAEYWLCGNCDCHEELYVYDMTSNSIEGNKLGNQKLLNNIKREIVNKLIPNFNVQILPDGYNIVEQIGKRISEYKKIVYKSLKLYDFTEFIDDLSIIISSIQTNALYWHKFLILKNRYWFISLDNNDIEERKLIKFDLLSLDQKALVIVLKEWLAMIVNESHLNPNYSMHIDKILYKLKNNHFQNLELFNSVRTNFFSHKSAIKLILSTMYNSSTPKQIEEVYSRFMTWRSNYMTNIFCK